MQVDGTPYRTVWLAEEAGVVRIIDQRKLPFAFKTVLLKSTEAAAEAILDMYVRGAGCIGAVAAHGMYLAAEECLAETSDPAEFEKLFEEKGNQLCSTRPTAVNLEWAVLRQREAVSRGGSPEEKVKIAREMAQTIADEDAEWCRRIGEHGLPIIREIF